MLQRKRLGDAMARLKLQRSIGGGLDSLSFDAAMFRIPNMLRPRKFRTPNGT
jgi:hypothetical protein